KTTGYAESVRELNYNQDNPLTENESIILGEINSYIIARETFDINDLQARYLKLQLSTEGTEFLRYATALEEENQTLTADVTRKVLVKSIVPNQANKSATIRFSTNTQIRNQLVEDHWVATLTYDFQNLPIELKRKYINPLGFIVLTYRVDQENIK
ncbi:MAG: type IV secretion system protein, partial [Litorimonas sp.]